MRLAWVEAAKVAPSAPAYPKTAATKPIAATTTKQAADCVAYTARQAALGANRLNCIANPVHIDAGQRTHLARLAADGNRIPAKVRVARDGRQRRPTRASRAALRFRIGRERTRRAQKRFEKIENR